MDLKIYEKLNAYNDEIIKQEQRIADVDKQIEKIVSNSEIVKDYIRIKDNIFVLKYQELLKEKKEKLNNLNTWKKKLSEYRTITCDHEALFYLYNQTRTDQKYYFCLQCGSLLCDQTAFFPKNYDVIQTHDDLLQIKKRYHELESLFLTPKDIIERIKFETKQNDKVKTKKI